MIEGMEMQELAEKSSSLEQMNFLQEQYEAAVAEGNEGAANFYKEQMNGIEKDAGSAEKSDSASEINESQEMELGANHSEKYWTDKAAEEYAKNGESAYYDKLMKYAGESHSLKK